MHSTKNIQITLQKVKQLLFILYWELNPNLKVSLPMITFSKSSYGIGLFEEVGGLGCGCYNVGATSKEPIWATRWSTATTIHCLAIDWHPTGSTTPSLIGYFTLICNVDEIAPMACSHGLARMAVYGEKASTTMKLTLTTLSLVCTGNRIIPFGIVVFPLNPINRASYRSTSSSLSPRPLNKLGYIISAPLPWSTITLLTLNLTIRKVTTRASSCGWIVPNLSFSENPMIGCSEILAFLHGASYSNSAICGDTNITPLTGWDSLLRVAKMTFIVPRDGRGAPLLCGFVASRFPWLSNCCKNYFNLLALIH